MASEWRQGWVETPDGGWAWGEGWAVGDYWAEESGSAPEEKPELAPEEKLERSALTTGRRFCHALQQQADIAPRGSFYEKT